MPILLFGDNQLNLREFRSEKDGQILISPQPGIEDIGNSKPGRAILNKIHAYPVQGIDVKELPGHAVTHVYRTLSGTLSGDPLVMACRVIMHKKLKTVVFLALITLSGLALGDLADSPLVPKEEAAFARDYLQKLREKSFDYVKLHLDPEVGAQVTDQKLEDVAKYFPAGKIISTELIGSQTNTFNSTWQGNFSFEYQFDDGWALANVVMKRADNKLSVIGFNVYRTENSQRAINIFSIRGKSFWHYAILVLAVVVPVFIVITLIVCVRTPISRKKWLWVLFVLGGIGSISINWTTGAMGFKVLQFLLLGSAYVRPSEYAPWVITVGFPVGAIVFWFKRRKFIAESIAEKSAQLTTPTATALGPD